MPTRRRLLFLVPAAIAILAVTAFAVVWVLARTPAGRGLVEREVTALVGLPATVESLRVGFLPSPWAEAGGLAIAQPPGFGPEPLVTVGRLRARLPWRSLFGASRVEAVSVSDATVRLAVGADGVSNWSALFAPEAPGPSTAAPEPATWSLGALDLERGTLEYRDAAAGSEWQLAAIVLSARDVAPAAAFPLELRLGGVFGTNTMHYAMKGEARLDPDSGRYEGSRLDFRGWAGGEPLPLAGAELTGRLARAAYEQGTGILRLDGGNFVLATIPGRFDGTLDLDEPALAATLRVATEPFAPRPPAVIFGHALPATTDPAAFESLQVALEARVADGALVLDPLSGRLDDTQFEGRVVPGERLIRATLDRIDVDRYLPRPPEGQARPRTRRETKTTLEETVAGLADFDLDAEIRIAEAQVAGAKVRDAVIRIERTGKPSP
jgi:hypothetical protein